MSEADPGSSPAPSGGLVRSLRELAADAVGVLQTRLELLAAEVEEARVQVMQLLLWGCIALLFLSFGLLMLTFAVVVLFWDTHRVLVVVLLGVAYLAVGAAVAVMARRSAQRTRLFAASLAELAKDREKLRPE